MTFVCPTCLTGYQIDDKFSSALKDKKDCKFCVRKDPLIPTTAEMDGLMDIEDIVNRDRVVLQCGSCNKWTDQNIGNRSSYSPCHNCGSRNYDLKSIKSYRTYNPITDNKRRIKAIGKKR